MRDLYDDLPPKQPEELYEEYKQRKGMLTNEQCDNKIVFRVCNKCHGKGKVCYGGMGDVFIYECPVCNGTGHRR